MALVPGAISPLYPILDASFLPAPGVTRERFLRSLMTDLLASGVSLLQYRNKTDTSTQVAADARVLRHAASGARCTLILNDYPGLVKEAGFDGVHLGQDDLSPEEARELIGPQSLLGVSTHTPQQIAAADQSSADYVAIGPVFATSSKADPDPVVGLEGVRRARLLTQKPLVAIGGITIENAAAVMAAGADSVAVISAVFAGGHAPGKLASDFFAKLR